jgi:hypothetical protein
MLYKKLKKEQKTVRRMRLVIVVTHKGLIPRDPVYDVYVERGNVEIVVLEDLVKEYQDDAFVHLWWLAGQPKNLRKDWAKALEVQRMAAGKEEEPLINAFLVKLMTNKYRELDVAAIEAAFSPERGFVDPMTVPWYREIFERGEKHGIEKGMEKGVEKGVEKSLEVLKSIGAPPEIIEAYMRKMKNSFSTTNGNTA